MHIRLRTDRFLALCEQRGWHTDSQRAKALGLHQANLMRLIRGDQQPSTKFIAACRIAWPYVPFDDLFETVQTEAVS